MHSRGYHYYRLLLFCLFGRSGPLCDTQQVHVSLLGSDSKHFIYVIDARVNVHFDFLQILFVLRVAEGHRETDIHILCVFECMVYHQRDFISKLNQPKGTVKKDSLSCFQWAWFPSLIMGLQ